MGNLGTIEQLIRFFGDLYFDLDPRILFRVLSLLRVLHVCLFCFDITINDLQYVKQRYFTIVL